MDRFVENVRLNERFRNIRQEFPTGSCSL